MNYKILVNDEFNMHNCIFTQYHGYHSFFLSLQVGKIALYICFHSRVLETLLTKNILSNIHIAWHPCHTLHLSSLSSLVFLSCSRQDATDFPPHIRETAHWLPRNVLIVFHNNSTIVRVPLPDRHQPKRTPPEDCAARARLLLLLFCFATLWPHSEPHRRSLVIIAPSCEAITPTKPKQAHSVNSSVFYLRVHCQRGGDYPLIRRCPRDCNAPGSCFVFRVTVFACARIANIAL